MAFCFSDMDTHVQGGHRLSGLRLSLYSVPKSVSKWSMSWWKHTVSLFFFFWDAEIQVSTPCIVTLLHNGPVSTWLISSKAKIKQLIKIFFRRCHIAMKWHSIKYQNPDICSSRCNQIINSSNACAIFPHAHTTFTVPMLGANSTERSCSCSFVGQKTFSGDHGPITMPNFDITRTTMRTIFFDFWVMNQSCRLTKIRQNNPRHKERRNLRFQQLNFYAS